MVLHCTLLDFTALQCTTNCSAQQWTSLHYRTLHVTRVHCIGLHCTTQHCTVLQCTVLDFSALQNTARYCSARYWILVHYKALHGTALQGVGLDCREHWFLPSVSGNQWYCTLTALINTARYCTARRWTWLQYKKLHGTALHDIGFDCTTQHCGTTVLCTWLQRTLVSSLALCQPMMLQHVTEIFMGDVQ